ncbi:MAG: hypothetical protein LBK59_04615 [Bifidobacteriaceae bacterium]|nr:hypothetical protein [Bifidobacteriaceae bacterium]
MNLVQDLYTLDRALSPIAHGRERVALMDGMLEAARQVERGEAARIVTTSRRMAELWFLSSSRGLNVPLANGVQVLSDRLIDLLPAGSWGHDDGPTLAVDDGAVGAGKSAKTMGKLVRDCERVTGRRGMVEARPLLKLPDRTAKDRELIVDFHKEFAMTFARHTVTGYSDAVVSRPVKSEPKTMLRIFRDEQWRTVDTTGAQAATKSIWTLSLFSVGEVRERFLASLGEARGVVDVLKVRVHQTARNLKPTARFVPIVLTGPLSARGLARWLRTRGLDVRDGDEAALAAGAALVSLVLSRMLFDVFREYAAENWGLEMDVDRDLLDLIAGRDLARHVYEDAAVDLALILDGEHGGGETSRSDTPAWPTEGLLVWPSRDCDANRRAMRVGDDAVRPVFEAVAAGSARGGARGLRGRRKRDPVTLRRVAQATRCSLAAASVALDVLDDAGWLVTTPEVVGERVERVARSAEYVPTYDDLPMCIGGGRLAVPRRTEEHDDEYLDDLDAEVSLDG